MNSFFTLRKKNMAAFLCIAFITAIVGITGFYGMKQLDSKFKVVLESAPLIQSATNMKLAVSQDLMVVMKLMAALDTDELDMAWKAHESFTTKFNQFTNAILNGATIASVTIFPAKDENLRKIVSRSATYHKNKFTPSFKTIFEQMNKKLSAENYDYDLMDTIDETTMELGKQLEIELSKVETIAQDVIKQAENEARKTRSLAVKITFIATVLGIVVAIILGIVFSGIVTNPVIKAAQFTEIVAEGDFTSSLDIRQKDEMGAMADAINKMVSSLAEIFKNITTGVGTLNESSSELSTVSKNLITNAQEMSEKSETVSNSAQEMNQRLASVSSLSEESSSNLDTVSAAMEEMNATVNEIAKNTGDARLIAGKAVEKAQSTSEKVNELGVNAKEIGKVTDVIGEISEQTNLLALNATIEAARAGEAGKGFGVVANEIKDLANQTAEAAKNIKYKIDRIQSSTHGTVVEIKEISTVINDVNTIVSSIASAIEEQSITAKEIAKNIAHAAEGIHKTNGHISESSVTSASISADISIVNENSTRVASSSRKVAQNAEKLMDFAKQLKQVVSRFKV
ncbi:MAG: methyl-accepting chemotaxis protein [Desulfobacula sp.]|nr:methyl-accepting chemotaxis protein [Desulfobacula sp.]